MNETMILSQYRELMREWYISVPASLDSDRAPIFYKGKRVILPRFSERVVLFERCDYCGNKSLDEHERCTRCGMPAWDGPQIVEAEMNEDEELCMEITDRDTSAYWQRYTRPPFEQMAITMQNGLSIAMENLPLIAKTAAKNIEAYLSDLKRKADQVKAWRLYELTRDERVGM